MRKVVKYSVDGTMKTELIGKAFPMAMGSQSITPGQSTLHSDRGTQYDPDKFRETMKISRYQDDHVAPQKLWGSLCC